MVLEELIIGPARKVFGFFASLKVAIPLLVITIAITIVGTLFPEPDWFKTWWYLGLLGLNGISLLFITILHIPLILKRKGRNALIGVVVTHLGILILIGGIIYGGFTGFRHKVKLLEGEVTVIPGLPFVVQVDEIRVEEYRQEEFDHIEVERLPKKTQQLRFTLLRSGQSWHSGVAEPGWPAVFEGITLLPVINDTGWVFDLVVTDHRIMNRENTTKIRPWESPLVNVGGKTLMAHARISAKDQAVEIFTLQDGEPSSLGLVRPQQPLKFEHYFLALGSVNRYMGVQIYNRPQQPVLIAGILLMLAGLIWHFYFRHRDRKGEDN